MKEVNFTSFDNTRLSCYLWDEVQSPKGVIQIIHGMASYASRYDSFSRVLNDNGYIVFADDHRAHGNTAGLSRLGLATEDNFINSVKDEVAITRMLQDKYNLPVQLFAHSYGSFLAQRYIELSNDMISGVLLSGSAHMGGNKLILGKIITYIQKVLFGVDKPSKLLYNIAFKSNNKHFLSDKIDNAWLNRDMDKVRSYNDDSMCGYVMSIGFYYSLMRGLDEIYLPSNLSNIRKDLPICILSGAMDSVGGMGTKVIKLHELYKSLDIEKLSMKLYDDVRHELTSDYDNEAIIKDMIDFYDSNIQ